MSEFPEDLKYADSHEYVKIEDGIASVGITSYAVAQLGDIVYVELPKIGTIFNKGDTFGVVESVKAVSDLYAPVNGKVIAINEILSDRPEFLAEDPYENGWIMKMEVEADVDVQGLKTSEEYSAVVSGL